MSEVTKKRRWPRRLLVLVVLIGAVAVLRDQLITRNERRYGPPAGRGGASTSG